jgi:L-methionine (R)-S-oxide reductase
MIQKYASLLTLCKKIITAEGTRDDVLSAVCFLLKGDVKHYSWVGIYLADDRKKILHLGPYAGEPTQHVKIPYGKGICGQAAESRETFMVRDVSQENNYLSCNSKVKSEIVIPIMKGKKFVAQLDIDSHQIDAFSDDDREFLEALCKELATLF